MQVDTADLAEVVRQVRALTGRVTKLSTEVRRTRERLDQATQVQDILRGAGYPAPRPQPPARHGRDRHGLRGINGGKR